MVCFPSLFLFHSALCATGINGESRGDSYIGYDSSQPDGINTVWWERGEFFHLHFERKPDCPCLGRYQCPNRRWLDDVG